MYIKGTLVLSEDEWINLLRLAVESIPQTVEMAHFQETLEKEHEPLSKVNLVSIIKPFGLKG